MKYHPKTVIIAISLALFAGCTAQAPVKVPVGERQYCERESDSAFCDALFREIVTSVNRRFEYRTDQALYGKMEWWAELQEVDGRLVGDCEDYALTIANRALEAGIAPEDMVLHLVSFTEQPNHVLLEYRGYFVDYRSRRLVSVHRNTYRKISHRRLSESYWR